MPMSMPMLDLGRGLPEAETERAARHRPLQGGGCWCSRCTREATPHDAFRAKSAVHWSSQGGLRSVNNTHCHSRKSDSPRRDSSVRPAPDRSTWDYFPHDQAQSRAYHWAEDELGGISDDKQPQRPRALDGEDPPSRRTGFWDVPTASGERWQKQCTIVNYYGFFPHEGGGRQERTWQWAATPYLNYRVI